MNDNLRSIDDVPDWADEGDGWQRAIGTDGRDVTVNDGLLIEGISLLDGTVKTKDGTVLDVCILTGKGRWHQGGTQDDVHFIFREQDMEGLLQGLLKLKSAKENDE